MASFEPPESATRNKPAQLLKVGQPLLRTTNSVVIAKALTYCIPAEDTLKGSQGASLFEPPALLVSSRLTR